jgi:hypothetical protein
MAMPLFADPANLKAREVEEGPEGQTSLELLQNIYRDRRQPLNARVRCAVEALAHEYPSLRAVAHTNANSQSFAEALDRAIARSNSPHVMNRPPNVIEHSAEEMKGPMPRLERRF